MARTLPGGPALPRDYRAPRPPTGCPLTGRLEVMVSDRDLGAPKRERSLYYGEDSPERSLELCGQVGCQVGIDGRMED